MEDQHGREGTSADQPAAAGGQFDRLGSHNVVERGEGRGRGDRGGGERERLSADQPAAAGGQFDRLGSQCGRERGRGGETEGEGRERERDCLQTSQLQRMVSLTGWGRSVVERGEGEGRQRGRGERERD